MSERAEMECKRCGDNENRINGFCSIECRDKFYLEEDIAELTTRIAELEAERRWRIIADGEMPEDRATVLVAFTEYPEQIDILTATYYKRYEGFGGVDNWWDIEGWHSGEVTHWMPLPESPEGEEE